MTPSAWYFRLSLGKYSAPWSGWSDCIARADGDYAVCEACVAAGMWRDRAGSSERQCGSFGATTEMRPDRIAPRRIRRDAQLTSGLAKSSGQYRRAFPSESVHEQGDCVRLSHTVTVDLNQQRAAARRHICAWAHVNLP